MIVPITPDERARIRVFGSPTVISAGTVSQMSCQSKNVSYRLESVSID